MGREGLIGYEIGMAIADPARHHTRSHPVHCMIAPDADLGIEQRHVDMRADLRFVAPIECRKHSRRTVDSGEQVGGCDAGFLRLALRFIRHAYIKRGTPQLNGKVERSHRSDQQEFYQLLSYKGDVDLEAKLAEWENFYNFNRPHGAFNGKTPYEALRERL